MECRAPECADDAEKRCPHCGAPVCAAHGPRAAHACLGEETERTARARSVPVDRSTLVAVVVATVAVLAVVVAAGGVLGTNAARVAPGLADGSDPDDDGLVTEYERELGTDPRDPDTDGDGLPDRVEVVGRTDDGVALPDADPTRKDLYVGVRYGAGIDRLSDAERRWLRRAFDEMPVSNPSGESGVDLHLDGRPPAGGRTDARLSSRFEAYGSAGAERVYRRAYDERRCTHRLLLFGRVTGGSRDGFAPAPGGYAVVDGRPTAGEPTERALLAVHELLHTVVGRFADGSGHTDAGYLAEQPGASDERLSRPAARALADGFERPPACG
jgi:hypothetical protein